MGIEGLTIEVPAGSVTCAKTIVVDAVITQERDGTLDLECERHNGRHTGSVDLAEILPYL